jgi:hypothetical protein
LVKPFNKFFFFLNQAKILLNPLQTKKKIVIQIDNDNQEQFNNETKHPMSIKKSYVSAAHSDSN